MRVRTFGLGSGPLGKEKGLGYRMRRKLWVGISGWVRASQRDGYWLGLWVRIGKGWVWACGWG